MYDFLFLQDFSCEKIFETESSRKFLTDVNFLFANNKFFFPPTRQGVGTWLAVWPYHLSCDVVFCYERLLWWGTCSSLFLFSLFLFSLNLWWIQLVSCFVSRRARFRINFSFKLIIFKNVGKSTSCPFWNSGCAPMILEQEISTLCFVDTWSIHINLIPFCSVELVYSQSIAFAPRTNLLESHLLCKVIFMLSWSQSPICNPCDLTGCTKNMLPFFGGVSPLFISSRLCWDVGLNAIHFKLTLGNIQNFKNPLGTIQLPSDSLDFNVESCDNLFHSKSKTFLEFKYI